MMLIGTAALLPLGILGFGATQVSIDRMTQKFAESQARTADQLASEIDLWLAFQLRMLAQQVDPFNLDKLNDRKLEAFQRLVYQQTKDVHIVSIVNDEGAEIAPSVFLSAAPDGVFEGKEVIKTERFEAFRKGLPLDAMREARVAWQASNEANERPIIVGRPYRAEGRSTPVVPIVVPATSDSSVYLAVEFALDRVDTRFVHVAGDGIDLALLDATGAPALVRGSGLALASKFKPFQPNSSCADVRFQTEDGTDVMGACAPVPGTGWMVAVAEPMEAITRAGEEIQDRTAFIGGVAALLSVLFGLLFSRGVTLRVTRVKDAALAVAEGNLGRTVSLDGSSEIRDLSRAFNFMSRRLSSNQKELTKQQQAISVFNDELQRRLDAQAEELTEANLRLVQSARLAAVGEMGAGLAHELNNPLAGILGLVQVLQQSEAGQSEILVSIEESTKRCSDIVQHLLRFSREGRSGAPLDESQWKHADLAELVTESLALVYAPCRAANVDLDAQIDGALLVRGDRDSLAGAVVQLLNSIRSACVQGGSIFVKSDTDEHNIAIRIHADAPLLDMASDDWMASGMGFWFARQVLAHHGGGLHEPADTDSGKGTWTIRLPRAK
jgi:two-component system NtrC family sensor kinase